MIRLIFGIILVLLLLSAFPALIPNTDNTPPEPTLTDRVLESRETPIVEEQTNASTYTILLLAAIVFVGAGILIMYFGADFLKQARLTRKAFRARSKSRRSGPRPNPAPAPPTLQPVPQLQQGHLPTVQELDRG